MTTEKGAIEILLDQGRVYLDTKSARGHGMSTWLQACQFSSTLENPATTLKHLLDVGFDLLETDSDGWNCLFFCVLEAENPDSSKELEALLFLLHRFPDICARDKAGKTIFDHLDQVFDKYRDSSRDYQRNLWYCGLDRMISIHGHEALSRCRHWNRNPHFGGSSTRTVFYTPVHSHALRYLDHWNNDHDCWSQVKTVLKEHPWSEHENKEMIRVFSEVNPFGCTASLTKEIIIDMAKVLELSPDPQLKARRRWKFWDGM